MGRSIPTMRTRCCRRTSFAILMAFMLLPFLSLPAALAQSYPTRPIKLIVPYAPGGPGDILGRLMAQKLTDGLGQPVVVDYRPGAGGTIGTEAVARSPADGYTLLIAANGALAINVTLLKTLPYDPLRDLTPVIHVATVPLILTVHPSVPARTVGELIALLKAKPNSYAFASAGNGTPQHLAGELFKSVTGVSMVHVPYKGTGPAVADLLAGQVDLIFVHLASTLSHVKAGKLKILATGGATRLPGFPDIPAINEQVPGFVSETWMGLVAPPRTSPDMVGRLATAVADALREPVAQKRIIDMNIEPVAAGPAQMASVIRQDTERWKAVIEQAKVKAD